MRILIRTPFLFDSIGGEVKTAVSILIEDGKILKIDSGIDTPDYNAQILDYTADNKIFVLPGLIDAHLHLAHGGYDAREKADSNALVAHRMYHNGLRNLLAGVTTQRDCGAKDHIDVAYREGLRLGLIDGPRTLICGQPIIATGGHCTYMGRKIDGPIEAMKAVREQIQQRVDFIKLMVTGGVSTNTGQPTTPQMTRDEIEAAVTIAHNNERPVAVHAEGGMGVRWALDAGIDTLEHGIYLTDEDIQRMLNRGTWFVPTLFAIHSIGTRGAEESVPLSQFMIEKCAVAIEKHADSFRRAYAAGVNIVAGTDYKHGCLVCELELMISLGLKNSEAIFAATKKAAEMLKLDREIGTIEPGKTADLLIVTGNPLEDIAALRNIRAVVQGGKLVVEGCMLRPSTTYAHYPIQ